MGYNAESHALLKPGYSKSEFWAAYKTMTDALRPWTIDFHVAQNDGEVHGTGSHDKTGKHCQADDPKGKLDIAACSKYWLEGAAHRGIKHICWDGCMFPNKVLETQKTWNTILSTMIKVREAAGYTMGATKGKPASQCTASTMSISTEGKKPVRIGLIGAGFMGRTHSNGYRKAINFFDTTHVPVLQAVCARTEASAKAFAKKWGYKSYETDWREMVKRDDIDAIDICTPQRFARRDCDCRRQGWQDDPLRKAARAQHQARHRDGQGCREGQGAQHGLVQLSPGTCGDARQATGR